MKTFPHKIRRIIEDSGLTVEAFADKIDVTRTVIYNIYAGQKPSMNFISKLIIKYPDIDLNWLLKEEQPLDPTSTNVQDVDNTELYNPEDQMRLVTMMKKSLEKLEKIVAKKDQT